MAERTALTAQKPEAKVESPVSRMQEPELSQFTSSPIDRIMFLQRTYGNQAVNRLLKSHSIQAKLKVSEPGDKYEKEADRVAEQVTGPTLQRKCTGKCPEDEEKKLIQRKTEGASEMTNTHIADSFVSNLGPGKPLDSATRAFFEPRFGHDFSGVRVHTDAKAAEMARAVNARAFTVGRHIVFGADHYSPHSVTGSKLLSHELTHAIQQQGAVKYMGSILLQRKLDKSCEDLLMEPYISDPLTGIGVHEVIKHYFRKKYGHVQFNFPDASAEPFSEASQVFGGKRKGEGSPDLAVRNTTGAKMLLAEIKPASYIKVAEGLIQLDNYIDKGNSIDNEELRLRLGVKEFSRMPPRKFKLPKTIPMMGRSFSLAWCSPGIIVYKEKKRKKKDKDNKKSSKEKWTGKSIEEQVKSGIDVAQVAYERTLRAAGQYEYKKPEWMSSEFFEEIFKLADGLYHDQFSAIWPGGYRANVVVWVHTSTFGRYIQFYHEYPKELEFYLKYAELHGGGKREADLLRKTFTEYNVDLLNLITDEYGPDDAKLDLQGIYEERLKLTFLQAFGLLSSGAQIGIFNSAIGVNPSITTHRARYLGTSPKPGVREFGGEIPYQRPYDTIEPWMIPRNLPSFRGIQKSLNKHTGSIQMPTLH